MSSERTSMHPTIQHLSDQNPSEKQKSTSRRSHRDTAPQNMAPSDLNTILQQSSPLYKLSKDMAASQAQLQTAKEEKLPLTKQEVGVSGPFRWLKKTGAFVLAITAVSAFDCFVRSFESSEPHPEDEMRLAFRKEGWTMMKRTLDEASVDRKRQEKLRWMRLRWSLDEGKWT